MPEFQHDKNINNTKLSHDKKAKTVQDSKTAHGKGQNLNKQTSDKKFNVPTNSKNQASMRDREKHGEGPVKTTKSEIQELREMQVQIQ